MLATIGTLSDGAYRAKPGSTVTVDSSNVTGFIYVVATQGSCTAYDGINIEEYGEEIRNANYWYFGDKAGINFNEQPPVAMSDGQLISPEGASTMSDQNGDLLFYSDGNVVYDRDHLQMDNGIQIGGLMGHHSQHLLCHFQMMKRFSIFSIPGQYLMQGMSMRFSMLW
jgi:hypothetical protein